MRPIVSIVGRPNVGKSTLFNKLVGQRAAITEDTPGVTRDRLYREVEWQNRYFLLMDTGGLEVDSDDIMATQIAYQVDLALADCQLVLFLVDGRCGVTAMDRMVAEKIRRSGKTCLVVVNKIDTHDTPNEVYEFYELGFPELFIISAEQQYGLGDLLDAVFAHLPEGAETEEQDDSLKIALIGKPNVGKSSMVNSLLGEERMIVTNIPGTTRDAIDSFYEREGKKYTLIDTAGLRRQRAVDSRIWDLVEKETNTLRNMEERIRQVLPFNAYAPILSVSVKTKQRMDRLFSLIDAVDEHYSFRISTGVLNDLVRDAVVMNPPPTDKGKRLKIFYASQVATRPPKFLFYVNDAELMHFSYLRYLENQLRKNFDFTGVALQLEVRERKE